MSESNTVLTIPLAEGPVWPLPSLLRGKSRKATLYQCLHPRSPSCGGTALLSVEGILAPAQKMGRGVHVQVEGPSRKKKKGRCPLLARKVHARPHPAGHVHVAQVTHPGIPIPELAALRRLPRLS